MSELSPGARDVLDRTRSAHDPTPADRARVRAALAAAIAGTAGAAGAAGAAPGGAASGAAGSAVVAGSAFPTAKLVVVAVLTCGAALGGGIALRGGDQVAQPAPSLVRPGPDAAARRELTPPAPVIDADPAPRESPPATVPDETGLDKESIAPRPARPRGATSRRAAQDPPAAGNAAAAAPAPAGVAPARGPVIAPVPSTRADSRPPAGSSGTAASLAAEAALLQRAAIALRRGDHAAALSLAGQHAARFPHSALDLERDALRAMALCQSGRLADGSALARQVARRAPSLPLASRVRRSCSME
jgi:hypothetical protein